MTFAGPLADAQISACIASLRTATASLEQLSPAALSALARAAASFVREAKRLRRRRVAAGIRRRDGERPGGFSRAPTPIVGPSPRESARAAEVAGRCHACRGRLVAVHPRYAGLCPPCGGRHQGKRTQTADLSGRVALVTGARVSSGFATTLKLLRAGAVVIGTSRFPRDAALRFAAEPDFACWSTRLHLYGLDFRSPAWVEAFTAHIAGTVDRLDILVNNAAQTVRRPASFYTHLVAGEITPIQAMDPPVRRVLAAGQGFARRQFVGAGPVDATPGALSAMLSQVRVLPEDATAALPGGAAQVPAGPVDDLRATNSWLLRLGEVATAECLEVLLVNAAAPFVLAGRLRERMARDALADKWIVNVSAVEGQFSRRHKNDRHPHLNMAKAALNMLTRSSAADYARDRIYMNSVDVGWFSNGEPAAVAAAMRSRGFTLPLDEIDAAARVCDPIFSGVRTGRNVHGKLLKDYEPVEW